MKEMSILCIGNPGTYWALWNQWTLTICAVALYGNDIVLRYYMYFKFVFRKVNLYFIKDKVVYYGEEKVFLIW